MDIEVRSLVNKMKDILQEEESEIAQKQETNIMQDDVEDYLKMVLEEASKT